MKYCSECGNVLLEEKNRRMVLHEAGMLCKLRHRTNSSDLSSEIIDVDITSDNSRRQFHLTWCKLKSLVTREYMNIKLSELDMKKQLDIIKLDVLNDEAFSGLSQAKRNSIVEEKQMKYKLEFNMVDEEKKIFLDTVDSLLESARRAYRLTFNVRDQVEVS